MNQFEIGEVVYYINKRKPKWRVACGTISEEYSSEVAVQCYELEDRRMVNGVPVKDLPIMGKRHKLPKNWTYGTELFNIEYKELKCDLYSYSVEKPEDILKAINDGVLVKVDDNDHCTIDTDISKDGWCIVKKYYSDKWPINGLYLNKSDVYRTYAEAEQVVKAYEESLRRQAEMSDYDWSVAQIDKTLNTWRGIYKIDGGTVDKVRANILEHDKVEDIEVRILQGGIQWKYTKNKQWHFVEV